ncbi:MAG: hypothetical protein MZV70_11220, partial [Desulfobacterales bacterium]|nr:hypothetical protein [Desulfobacterales bacterium]
TSFSYVLLRLNRRLQTESTAPRQGVKEEDQVLMKRKYELQARRTGVIEKIEQLSLKRINFPKTGINNIRLPKKEGTVWTAFIQTSLMK